jgi:pimeloyl-ACP methyl ester carboxylesterase
LPALFVYGDKDIRPSWPIEQVVNLMPNARFEFIEGAEHIIWFSHPNELESILRNFVDHTKRKELFSEAWSVDTTPSDSTVCHIK